MTETQPGVALESAVKIARRRLLPILFLLGLICLLDRASVGYAALTMNADIGLSAAAYGFGAGIFFFGYVIFEVPSNLIMQKVGVRLWIVRIGISWGLVMILMAFIWDEWSFYGARLLLGLAEAGLFPAVYFLLGRWFPAATRARVLALFLACNAIAGIIGGPLASLVFVASDAAGVPGWRVLFVVLGIPAIIFALVGLRVLVNEPAEARWLSAEQRTALMGELAREQSLTGVISHTRVLAGLGRAVRSINVWCFVLIFFVTAMANYGLILFLPQIIQSFAATSPAQSALLSSIPSVAGLVAMLLVARNSDRVGERRWHYVVLALVGAVALLATGSLLHEPVLAMVGLCFVVAGVMPLSALIFARVGGLLAGTAAAAGIALINSLGSIGGFTGPYLIGWLQGASGSFYTGLIALALALVIGAVLTLALRTPDEKQSRLLRAPAPEVLSTAQKS